MTTQTDATGFNTYTPGALGATPDVRALLQPNGPLPSVRGIGPHRIRGPYPVGRDRPNFYVVRCEWYDARGGYRQVGYPSDHAAMASGDLVGDDQGILRLPFLTTAAATPDPTANDYRMSSANGLGAMVCALFDSTLNMLYRETSSTNPAIAAVTGFVPPGTNVGITHLGQVYVNATPYLGIGWNGTNTNTFQVISNYNNPPTSSTAPVGTDATWWFYQTPIDGDAIIMQLGSQLITFRTDIGVGSTVLVVRKTGLAQGSYGVGLVNIDGPGVAWVAPVTATTLIFNAAASSKGRVLMADYRGFNIREVKFPLKWVTFATEFQGGIFACDQESHYYRPPNSSQPIPVDIASDRAANSNKVRKCRGHWRKGDKMFYEINETITASGTGATTRYFMEYDYHLNTVRQVSKSVTLSTTGELTIGGALQPSSEQNDFLHCYSDGSWYRQYQPPSNVTGYSLRKISGAAASTGQEFATTGTWTPAALTIPGFEGARLRPIMATLMGDVDAGGTGGTPATVAVTEAGQTLTFVTGQPAGRIQRQRFRRDNTITYRPQPTVTATQQASGTDPTRFTPNCFPLAIDYELYLPPLGSKTNAWPEEAVYQGWDAYNE